MFNTLEITTSTVLTLSDTTFSYFLNFTPYLIFPFVAMMAFHVVKFTLKVLDDPLRDLDKSAGIGKIVEIKQKEKKEKKYHVTWW